MVPFFERLNNMARVKTKMAVVVLKKEIIIATIAEKTGNRICT